MGHEKCIGLGVRRPRHLSLQAVCLRKNDVTSLGLSLLIRAKKKLLPLPGACRFSETHLATAGA